MSSTWYDSFPNFFKVFLTTSYDATTHFETTCQDIMALYKRCTGEDIDFSQVQKDLESVEQ